MCVQKQTKKNHQYCYSLLRVRTFSHFDASTSTLVHYIGLYLFFDTHILAATILQFFLSSYLYQTLIYYCLLYDFFKLYVLSLFQHPPATITTTKRKTMTKDNAKKETQNNNERIFNQYTYCQSAKLVACRNNVARLSQIINVSEIA